MDGRGRTVAKTWMRRWAVLACAAGIVAGGVLVGPGPAFAANPTDSTFAGYIASQPEVSSAVTNFPVPKITCDVGSNLAMAVGVLIYGNTTGTATASGAIIRAQCINGTRGYQAEVLVNGAKTISTLKVRPGNLIEIDLAESPTATTATIVNHTSGKSFSQSDTTGVAMTLAEIGTIGIGGTSGPPPFKSVTFSANLVNGTNLDSLSPAPAAWDWANSGVTVIHTSRITADQFTTKHV
jgi:hypothetical protein